MRPANGVWALLSAAFTVLILFAHNRPQPAGGGASPEEVVAKAIHASKVENWQAFHECFEPSLAHFLIDDVVDPSTLISLTPERRREWVRLCAKYGVSVPTDVRNQLEEDLKALALLKDRAPRKSALFVDVLRFAKGASMGMTGGVMSYVRYSKFVGADVQGDSALLRFKSPTGEDLETLLFCMRRDGRWYLAVKTD